MGFSLFTHDIESELGKAGKVVSIQDVIIHLLLFADDTDIFANSAKKLQKK